VRGPTATPSQSPAFKQRYSIAPEVCFSIVHVHRTIDLESSSEELRDRFCDAFKKLLEWRQKGLGEAFSEKRKIKMVLTKGAPYVKFNDKKGQERFLWVDTKLEHLYWGERKAVVNNKSGKFKPHKAKGCILIDDIKKIITTCPELVDASKVFADRFAANESCCMRIEAEGRSIDLEAANQEVRDAWVNSLRTVVALGVGSEKKKIYMFEGEDGNEDLTDEDQGKELDDIDSEDEKKNLPKIQLKIPLPKTKRGSEFEENKKELLVSNLPPIEIAPDVENFVLDLQCDIGADKSFLLKIEGNIVRAAWIEGISDSNVLSRYCFNVGQGVIGKLAEKKENEVVVLPDAYENPEFDKTFDTSCKYKTTSFLAVNIGKGIVCFANKQDMHYKKDYFQESHVQPVLSKVADLKGLLHW